jgi:hypothetical protein
MFTRQSPVIQAVEGVLLLQGYRHATVTPSSLVGGGDHDEWSPIFIFWGRLHLISREIERDAVILVGAGRKVERELRSWQPCICPTRRSPQNERDETRLKPKKPRDEIIRIGSCAIFACVSGDVGDEPDQGTALEAAGGRPPPSGFTLSGEGHHTQSRPSGAGQKKSPGCEHGRGRCGSRTAEPRDPMRVTYTAPIEEP